MGVWAYGGGELVVEGLRRRRNQEAKSRGYEEPRKGRELVDLLSRWCSAAGRGMTYDERGSGGMLKWKVQRPLGWRPSAPSDAEHGIEEKGCSRSSHPVIPNVCEESPLHWYGAVQTGKSPAKAEARYFMSGCVY